MAREDDEFELQALFDKVLDGKATPEERRRVAELRTDPVHDEAYRAYERMTALAPEQDEKRVAALIPAGFATSVMEGGEDAADETGQALAEIRGGRRGLPAAHRGILRPGPGMGGRSFPGGERARHGVEPAQCRPARAYGLRQ